MAARTILRCAVPGGTKDHGTEGSFGPGSNYPLCPGGPQAGGRKREGRGICQAGTISNMVSGGGTAVIDAWQTGTSTWPCCNKVIAQWWPGALASPCQAAWSDSLCAKVSIKRNRPSISAANACASSPFPPFKLCPNLFKTLTSYRETSRAATANDATRLHARIRRNPHADRRRKKVAND